MAATKRKKPIEPPELTRRGYAIFVKLWQLTFDTPADLAVTLVDALDKSLLAIVNDDSTAWFPSPHGGAVVVRSAEEALEASRLLMRSMTSAGVSVSVAITWGRLDRIQNVSRWNAAALAINLGARMANAPRLKGRVLVSEKVRSDIIQARHHLARSFGPRREATIKRTTFAFHLATDDGYKQPTIVRREPVSRRSKSRAAEPADIVCFDIEKYSELPARHQARVATALSECVELALAGTQTPMIDFGPAGDGGYVAFRAGGRDSGPVAWAFATALSQQSRREKIRIRMGIAHGPVMPSRWRRAVGGSILRADSVSSIPPTHSLAATTDFWQSLADSLKKGWRATPAERDPDAFVLSRYGTTRFAAQPPPDRMSLHNVRGGPAVEELDTERQWIDTQVEAIDAAQSTISLCLHTIHASSEVWKARTVNDALARACARGVHVRMLAASDPERLLGPYQLDHDLKIDIHFAPEIKHYDLRFVMVDSTLVVLGVAVPDLKKGRYRPSRSWATLRSSSLCEALERDFQRMWLSPNSVSFSRYCSYAVKRFGGLPTAKLARDLGLDYDVVKRFAETRPFAALFGDRVLIFQGSPGAGKSSLMRVLEREHGATRIDLQDLLLPYIHRYGIGNIGAELMREVYEDLIRFCRQGSFDALEIRSDCPPSVISELLECIKAKRRRAVLVMVRRVRDTTARQHGAPRPLSKKRADRTTSLPSPGLAGADGVRVVRVGGSEPQLALRVLVRELGHAVAQ